jgi:hypothetical protein
MGLSGVVASLFVIEPSAHLTDPGRARRYAVSVGLVPQHSRRRCSSRISSVLPAALVRRRNVGVSLILDFAWSALSANCLSRREPEILLSRVVR